MLMLIVLSRMIRNIVRMVRDIGYRVEARMTQFKPVPRTHRSDASQTASERREMTVLDDGVYIKRRAKPVLERAQRPAHTSTMKCGAHKNINVERSCLSFVRPPAKF